MRFNATNTDIPEELLSAQEEGRVVFFCGAGISYDAKIPVFDGLLKKTAEGLNHELTPAEKRLFKAKKFDELYQEYERAFQQPTYVRRITEKLLHPAIDPKGKALSKHCSLLKLARSRNGETRLVTTNYDCLFDEAQKALSVRVPSFAAPLLPVPKDYKWDGIVYLHGKLQESPSDSNLLSLVLSSGDFGQAYLTERWASRFVTELFRDHIICFVGYSVNDVILKYMMDALASEELKGGSKHPVYAFSACKKGHEEECRDSWQSKGIRAIPYRATPKRGHVELTHVLEEWARHYETGRLDKGVIVRTCLKKLPDTVSEDGRQEIARFQWALRDELGAKALPEPNDGTARWLEYLPCDEITPDIRRCLVGWVGRHFKYPESLQWCVRHKVMLDEDDYNTLNWCLRGVSSIEPELAELWRLFLSDMQMLRRNRFVEWIRLRESSPVLTAGLRQMFKSIIQPTLAISAVDNYWFREDESLRRYFEWNIVLDSSLSIFDAQESQRYLAELLPELTNALVDACAMLESLGDHDYSYMHVSSLSDEGDHVYSKEEWYYLIVLIKNAVLGLGEKGTDGVCRLWEQWKEYDYPAFYRLMLWCACKYKEIPPDNVVRWIEKHPSALWIDNCARELYDFLDARASEFEEDTSLRFQRLILDQYENSLITEACKATRLEHFLNGHGVLSREANQFLEAFEKENPSWAKRKRQLDGIRVFDEDYDEVEGEEKDKGCALNVPTQLDDAIKFFKRKLSDGRCQFPRDLAEWMSKDLRVRARFLVDLGCKKRYWSVPLWEAVFSQVTNEVAKCVAETFLAEDVKAVPREFLSSLRIRFAFWAQAAAKSKVATAAFRDLCCRFLFETVPENEVVGTANANAPYELVAEALLRIWFDTKPQVGSGLSEPFRDIFTKIANGTSRGMRFARRELLRQIASFYAVDPEWTMCNLASWLSWTERPNEALEAWNHAVMSQRYEPQLLRAVWSDFEETGRRYEKLDGPAREWYAALIFHHSLQTESREEKLLCARILRAMPPAGREEVARQFYLRADTAGDKADAVWEKELLPFLKSVWPGEAENQTSRVFTHFADAIVCLGESFPSAVEEIARFTMVAPRRISMPMVFLHGDKGSYSHCDRHPAAALKLLSMLTKFSASGELMECLKKIKSADISLANRDEFKRLCVEAKRLEI